MSLLSDIRHILSLDCHESSRLLSESFERKLRLPERIALRLHRVGCWSCRRLKRQFDFLHQTAKHLGVHPTGTSDSDQPATATLSPEAQLRMKLALRQQRDETP